MRAPPVLLTKTRVFAGAQGSLIIPPAPATNQLLRGLDGLEKTRSIGISDLLCRQSTNLSAMTVNDIPQDTGYM